MRSLAVHNSYGETSIRKIKKSWSKGSNCNKYLYSTGILECSWMNNTMMSYRRVWNVKGYARQCMAMHCYALAVFISDAWLPSNDE